jgi:hypothetical protein
MAGGQDLGSLGDGLGGEFLFLTSEGTRRRQGGWVLRDTMLGGFDPG